MPPAARTSSTGKLWPRFAMYVIADGYIRPAPGSRLEWYDPYEEFEALSNRSATKNPAYDDLISVTKTFAAKAPSDQDIANAKTARKSGRRPELVSWRFHASSLLDWVRQHGLLGLLHHTLVSASFWKDGVEESALTWSRSGWRLVTIETRAGSADLKAFWKQLGYLTQSHAVIRAGSGTFVRSPPEQAWAKYFPMIADKDLADVPRLLATGSERAWRQYAEPIDDFVNAALSLRNMLTSLLPARNPNALQQVALGLFTSDELMLPARSGIDVGTDGLFRLTWSSPSLLGHLAMTAAQDVARTQRIVVCPKCGTTHASSTATYCSDRCKRTIQMRRYRATKRTESSRKKKVVRKTRGVSKKKP